MIEKELLEMWKNLIAALMSMNKMAKNLHDLIEVNSKRIDIIENHISEVK